LKNSGIATLFKEYSGRFLTKSTKTKILPIFLNLVLALTIFAPRFSHAIVAGGMAAINRTWPQVATGYTDMEFFITITKAPGFNGRTYWAHQWSYTGKPEGGYVGLQSRNGNEKVLNFSIWGATGWRDAIGTHCSHFGHEGSGVQCWIPFPWKEGITYRIKVMKSGVDGWTASITDIQNERVTPVATIIVPESYGGLKGLMEWVENFSQGDQQYSSCLAVPEAVAVYGIPQANGGTVKPTSSSTYTYGNCKAVARSVCTTEQVCTLSVNPSAPFVQQHVQNRVSLYCLDMLGGGPQAGLWDCLVGNPNQSFTQDDTYRLHLSGNNGLCLSVDANNLVKTSTCDNSARQQWLKVDRTQAYFNAGTTLCMDPLDNASRKASIRVHQCLENDFQRWGL
jgi:hypothetical protein